MATPNKTYEDKSGNTFKTRDEALRSNQSQINVTAPLGSTERTNQLLGGNYFDTTTGKQTQTFNPIITSDNLKPIPQIKLPNAPTPTYGNIDTAINASLSTAKQDQLNRQNKAIEDAKTAKDNNLKDILDIQNILGQSGQKQEQAYQEQGVDTLRTQYDDYTNQLEQEQQVLKRKLERIEKNPEGVSETGLQERLRTTERESLSKQADLAVLQNSALRKYDTARDIADRKVQLELEPLKAKLETMKFIYQENKEIFNTQEKRRYEDIIRQEERQYKTEEENKTKSNDYILNAIQSGAPTSLITKAQSIYNNGGTSQEVASVLGDYTLSQAERLDRRYKNLQIQKLQSEINTSVNPQSNIFDVSKITANGTASDKNNAVLSTVIQNNPKIGQGTKTALANILGVIASTETFANNAEEGKFTGLNPFRTITDIKIPFTDIGLPFRESLKQQKTVQNEQYINGINLKVQQWASGASLTTQQTEQVEKMTPKVTDTDGKVRTKLNELANFMLTQAKSTLQSEGITYIPEKIDYFDKTQNKNSITNASNEDFLRLAEQEKSNSDFFNSLTPNR